MATSGAVLVVALSGCSGSSTAATQPATQTDPSVSGTHTQRSGGSSTKSGTTASHTVPPASTTTPQSNPPATEFRPPGDIPDNQVYVDYAVPGSAVHLKVPEGWARSSAHGTTTFTDHYNSIAVTVQSASQPPTVASTKRTVIPQLRSTVPKFAPGTVSTVQRLHGKAVLTTYQLDSAPSAVTGKVVRDAAERFAFWHHGQEAVLTLTGPTSADNVDPWKLVSDSLQWR
jgi:hypothetical protein